MDKNFKIVIGFSLFIAILLIFSAILPTTITIEKSIVINKNSKSIFEQVNNLENWTKWMPSMLNDSSIVFGNKKTGKGASYSWKNNNKINNLQIMISDPYHKITTETLLNNKNPVISEWTFESTSEGTIVSIKMNLKISFPFNIMGPLVSNSIEKNFELALQNIKTNSQ